LACDAPPRQCLEWHIKPKLRKARESEDGNGYRALCPAHDDRSHSFSISVSDDGKRLLYRCFACENRRRERLALIHECGISPGCLPTPAREKEELLDYIEGLAAADTDNHAEVRLRIMAALEGYYPDLPRGRELERVAGRSSVSRATAFSVRRRDAPAETDKTSSYPPQQEPVKPRRSR
jgi:hypothetical protein